MGRSTLYSRSIGDSCVPLVEHRGWLQKIKQTICCVHPSSLLESNSVKTISGTTPTRTYLLAYWPRFLRGPRRFSEGRALFGHSHTGRNRRGKQAAAGPAGGTPLPAGRATRSRSWILQRRLRPDRCVRSYPIGTETHRERATRDKGEEAPHFGLPGSAIWRVGEEVSRPGRGRAGRRPATQRAESRDHYE